jgi:hypothetical protein
LGAFGTGADHAETLALVIEQVETGIEIEDFFWHQGTDQVEGVKAGVFLCQVEKDGKGLFLETLEVIPGVTFLFLSNPFSNDFQFTLRHGDLFSSPEGQD